MKDILEAFILETRARFNKDELRLDNIDTHMTNIGAIMKSLEVQIGQLATVISSQPSGKFSSDTEVNLMQHCNAITLRNSKEIVESKLNESTNVSNQEEERHVKHCKIQVRKSNKTPKSNSISFPNNRPILKSPLPYP